MEACSSWFLPRIIGIGKASEWVLTGRVFTAKEVLKYNKYESKRLIRRLIVVFSIMYFQKRKF
jgi:hypothetical protein